jgi:Holliday junction resolvase
MPNKKDLGLKLENQVAEEFRRIGFPKARPSKGSGSRGEAGDIAGQTELTVECKQRTTKDITLKEDVWLKLCKEIPYHSSRKPMYVLGNQNNKVWCVLDLRDFFDILKGHLENAKKS